MGVKISALTAAVSSPTSTDLFEVSRYNGSTYDSRRMTWAQILAGIAAAVGSVTSVSVATANGFGGSVANATTTPAITITTSISGLLNGNGTAVAAATDTQVTSYLLTGVSITGGSIAGTDTMIQAFGKLQNQINSLVGGATYQGTWNATTNSPALASGVGTNGHYYVVSVAGTTNLDGVNSWSLGDWAIFNGTVWQKVDNTDAVISVNGLTGAVALTGTANRLTVSGANVFDISASYVGQSSITTLGTITTGTWNGTAIAAAYGGTGQTSYTTGDLLYASGTTTISKLGIGTNGYVLTVSGGVPVWAAAGSGVTGSGASPYYAKWNSTTNLTGAMMYDDGTTVYPGGILKIGAAFSHSTIVVAALTANVTNWSLGNASYFYVSSNAVWTVEGITAPTVETTGTEKTIINTGSFNILFTINSGTTTAANRIYSPSPIILTPGNSITFVYDGGYGGGARWRVQNPALGVTANVNSLITSARIISDVTKSASTAFSNLTELTVATVVGKKYKCELDLYITTTSTGGAKVDFAGTATNWVGHGNMWEDTPALLASKRLTALGDTVNSNGTSSANIYIKVVATFVANSTTLIPRFAQNSAAGASTAKAHSTFVITEII